MLFYTLLLFEKNIKFAKNDIMIIKQSFFKIFICIVFGAIFTFDIFPNSFVYMPQTGKRASIVDDSIPSFYCNINRSANYIEIEYNINKIYFNESPNLNDCYSVSIDKFGKSFYPQKADLPTKYDQFLIDQEIDKINISVTESSFDQFEIGLLEQKSPDTSDYNLSDIDCKAVVSSNLIVDSIFSINTIGKRGNKTYLNVSFSPIAYDVENNQVTIYKHVKCRIDFETNEINAISQISSPDNEYLGNEIFRSYLIVTTDSLVDILDEFINWKRNEGYYVYLRSNDEWNFEGIEAAIKDTYYSDGNLHNVLIIGDEKLVPSVPNSFNGWDDPSEWNYKGKIEYVSDFPYSCITNDSIPDIYIGRIPAQNVYQAKIVIDKILSTTKQPQLSPDFYTNSIHSCIFDTDTADLTSAIDPFVYGSEELIKKLKIHNINVFRNYYASPEVSPKKWGYRYGFNKEIPLEIQRPNFNWDGNAHKVIELMNSGVFYVLNAAHGSKCKILLRLDKSLYSHLSNILLNELTNINKYPIVFNESCSVGYFGREFTYDQINLHGGQSLTQYMLNLKDAGTNAVFAASNLSVMGITESMSLGFINALFPSPKFDYTIDFSFYGPYYETDLSGVCTLGRVLEICQDYQAAYFGRGTGYQKYNERVFHLFGDPSMIVHTTVPTKFSGIKVVGTLVEDDLPIVIMGSEKKFADIHAECDSVSNMFMTISDATGMSRTFFAS